MSKAIQTRQLSAAEKVGSAPTLHGRSWKRAHAWNACEHPHQQDMLEEFMTGNQALLRYEA